ncbi:MAG: hypothetical protein Q9170_007596 [Blastenia crenularia]
MQIMTATTKTESLRILLIGGGGREHALAWKLSQSSQVETIFCAPGNGGTGNIPKALNVPYLSDADLLVFVRKSNIGLVVVGPEVPLVAGIVDRFESHGIQCFGPKGKAAAMEGSKWLGTIFQRPDYKVVLKADGLAAGKGVILPSSDSRQQMYDELQAIMVDKKFEAAGNEVVIEEYLEGQELSFISFSDGYTIKSLPPAQDHKQIFDNDQGPNTGGMGCYAPTPIATKELVEEVHRTILQPTIAGMRKERMPFKGILFTGIMMTKDGPKVLEYNVRFGDPETQTLLPLMESDLAEVMLACANGYLDAIDIKCKPGSCVTVVAAAKGYPDTPKKGDPITIDAEACATKDTYIFHAGTSLDDSGAPKTAGGRVIAATAVAPDLETALSKAYGTMSKIHFEGMHYRRDIAHRALSPAKTSSSIPNQTNGLTYASSGVSITNGNTFVSTIKPLVATTRIPGSTSAIGSFGGAFDLHLAGFPGAPRLISGVDGVGTKLRIAQRIHKHDTIGIDLVAMCVNDILCEGATPLWFMDTYSCNKLDVGVAVEVVKGIVKGCRMAGVALIGGETAEMGAVYREGEYDLVGAATGAIAHDKPSLPRKEDMRVGDAVLGLGSTGCHSNGFSLIQKIVEGSGCRYTDPAPWNGEITIGEALLEPTRIYVKSMLKVMNTALVKGVAHITGGGLLENVPRCLPGHLAAELDVGMWEVPGVFRWLQKSGRVENKEMARVFNMGVGMVVVVAEKDFGAVMEVLEGEGEKVMRIGKLAERSEGEGKGKGAGCVIKGLEDWA